MLEAKNAISTPRKHSLPHPSGKSQRAPTASLLVDEEEDCSRSIRSSSSCSRRGDGGSSSTCSKGPKGSEDANVDRSAETYNRNDNNKMLGGRDEEEDEDKDDDDEEEMDYEDEDEEEYYDDEDKSISSYIPEETYQNELALTNTPSSALPGGAEALKFTDDELIELSILREEEIDQLISHELLPEDDRFNPSLHEKLVFEYTEMILTLETGPSYPVLPPKYAIENIALPRLVVDSIRIALREAMVLFDKGNAIKRWLTRAEDSSNYGAFASDNIALQLAKVTNERILDYRGTVRTCKPDGPVDINSASSRDDILKSLQGVDTASYNTSATVQALLGKTIQEVCDMIPSHYRILHVENVVKGQLYADFHKVQEQIRDRLLKYRPSHLRNSVPVEHQRKTSGHSTAASQRELESLVDYLVTPKCTFHGTQRHAVSNIIRHGFLRPGDINPATNKVLEVRCGNTYGRGIYTSPSPQFSLSYSGWEAAPTEAQHFSGLKLIVCATIMGRPAQMSRGDNWRELNHPYPNADSHVANMEHEYIVFNPRQTIPVLVVHLDWGKEHYDEFVGIPGDPKVWIKTMQESRRLKKGLHEKLIVETLFPGDRVKRKEALMAKALKWFPYGYGPATGTKFVIEAVGEVSDDEEEYGEYQKDKTEGSKTGGDAEGFWEKQSREADEHSQFDEFFSDRWAKTVRPRVFEVVD